MSRAYQDAISAADFPDAEFPPYEACERCGAPLTPPHDRLCRACELIRDETELQDTDPRR